jgi:hypothetical protein
MNGRGGICTFAWGSLKLANQDTLETRKKTQKKGEANTQE